MSLQTSSVSPITQTWTVTWQVYKITFEDDYAYVGITNQPVPDRIQSHINTPVNAELSRRLRAGHPYQYETLHEVDVNSKNRNGGIQCVYLLEREEIYKLEKPINIYGINPNAKRIQGFWGHEQAKDNIARKYRKRTKKNVHPPREGVYRCSICGEAKPHTEFGIAKSRYNGLQSRCRDCNTFRQRKGWTSDQTREYIANGGTIPKVVPRLTPAQRKARDKQIVRLYKTHTAEEIAEKVGCSTWTVQNTAWAAGLKKRYDHKEMIAQYRNGLSVQGIARVHGCSDNTVRVALKKAGVWKRPPPPKKFEVISLFRAGRTCKQIAKSTDLHIAYVRKVIRDNRKECHEV